MFGAIRRVANSVRSRLPVRPRAYWTERHAARGAALSAPGHIDLSEQENARDYETKRERLSAVLNDVVPDRAKRRNLLDAGCGSGQMFPVWLDLGFRVSAIDFAPSALAIAKSPQVRITAGDITSLKFDERFQIIACVDVLFHVLSDRKWKQFLSSARRTLDKDGFLLIQEHLVDESDYRGVVRQCHMRRKSDYVAALRSAGLAITRHERYDLPCEQKHKDILVLVAQ